MSLPAPVYILSAARTPIGSFLGSLAPVTAPRLGAVAIGAAVERARVPAGRIDAVFMGNVLTANVGQAPSRQAALYAGLPQAVPATTIGKVCGSGLEAVIAGVRAIALGDADAVVAGGMESMSNTPYYAPGVRRGLRMGHGPLVDGMIQDGLWDPYGNVHMGECGELCAREFGISRDAQDAFARESYRRALTAQRAGDFRAEIAPVAVPRTKVGLVEVVDDEGPAAGNPERFATLPPVFAKDGTITAANASSINDGAAAVVLASERMVRELDVTPLARVVGYAGAAQAPEWFTTAPVQAIANVTKRVGIEVGEVDLVEINEAFAVVAMVVTKLANLDPSRVNIRGGAVALGHPIGASGARILTTLLFAMSALDKRRGLATLCIGGGEALAMIVER